MGGTTPQSPQNRRTLILLAFLETAANHRTKRRREPPRKRFQRVAGLVTELPQTPRISAHRPPR
jgi:hypothetical protein